MTEALLGRISRKDNPQMVLGAFEQRWDTPDLPSDTASAESAGSVPPLWIARPGARSRQSGHYYAYS